MHKKVALLKGFKIFSSVCCMKCVVLCNESHIHVFSQSVIKYVLRIDNK